MNDAFNSAALHLADYIKADVKTAHSMSPQLDKDTNFYLRMLAIWWPRKCSCGNPMCKQSVPVSVSVTHIRPAPDDPWHYTEPYGCGNK